MTTKIQQFLAECRERRGRATQGVWTNIHKGSSGEFFKSPEIRFGPGGGYNLAGNEIEGGIIYDEGRHTEEDATYIAMTCCPTTGTAKRTEEALAEAVRALEHCVECARHRSTPSSEVMNAGISAQSALACIERILGG